MVTESEEMLARAKRFRETGGRAPSPKLEPLPEEPVADFRGALERVYPEMFDAAYIYGTREEDIPDTVWGAVSAWSQEDPESFIADLVSRGNIEDAEILLSAFGTSLTEVEEIITPTTETGWQAAWNKLVTGAYRFAFQTRDYFLTILPQEIFKDVEPGERRKIQMLPFFAPEVGAPYSEEEATRINQLNQNMRDKFRKAGAQGREQYEEWVAKHPELRPPPEWEGEILPLLKKDPTLILDPAFIGYIAADSASFMAAFWTATAAVGFATKNPILGMTAGVVVTTPAQSQDLYEDLLWAGATEQQASEIAVPMGLLIASVEMMGGLAVLRAVGVMPGMRPFYQLFRKNLNRQVAKGLISTMAKRGLISFTEIEIAEIFEEIIQGAIQNALVKTFDESREVLGGITETVLRTFISVFPLALIGGGTNTVVTYKQMSKDQRGKVEAEQAKMEDAGLPPEQAEMIAMTDFAQTPEGQEVIDKAIEEVTVVEEVKPPTVKEVIPEVPEAISEGGVPVPPEETIAQGIEDNTPLIKDIGVKEKGRPTRRVFEKIGLYTIWKGIQEAEVLIGEERATRRKEIRKVMKTIDRTRREFVFDEVNKKGSVVGLTFAEKRAVNFIRKWADEWANKKNLPQEKRIKDYIPHLFEEEMKAQLKETGQISPELANILSEKVQKKITDPFLKKRLGAVGFQKDPFLAMEAYDAASLRVLYYEPFLQKIASVANDISAPPLIREYLKDYSRRMTGEPSRFDTSVNNTMAEFADVIRKLPGGGKLADALTQGNTSGLAAYNFTSVLYTLWLGFKPTSAIRNLSQHTLIVGEVGPMHFANAIRLRFTKEGNAVLAKSLVLRSRKAAFVPGIDDSFMDGWSDKFREAALYMFRLADKQNVSDAFLAGYSEAKSLLPDADEQLWIDRGDEVAADTQYLYTKMNSMAVSQNAIGRVFSVLTTWAENWMELMTKWVSKRPSSVYLQYEKETGKTLPKKNWSQTYKAISMYMIIIALGFLIKEETRLKAWEYTGLTSIRYLADILGGDFPGLQAPGAIAKVVAGFVIDDERMLKEGWAEMKGALTPGIVRQLQYVGLGEKDWMTLLFYLEGKDIDIKRLKEDWKKELELYNELPLKDRTQYREDNPKIEAKLFVLSQISTLSTDEARAEVLLLIAKHDLDSELIDGYAKVFAKDGKVELKRFEDRLGNLEKLEVGEEAEYFMTSDYASEVNRLVKTIGRTPVGENGSPLTVAYLNAKDLMVQYDNIGETDVAPIRPTLVKEFIVHLEWASGTHKSDSTWDKEWRGHYANIIRALNEIKTGRVEDYPVRRISGLIQLLQYDIKLDKGALADAQRKGDTGAVAIYGRAIKGYQRIVDALEGSIGIGASEARRLYRQQFPDMEAQLYLWGRISTFQNPYSAVIFLSLMKKHNLPPEAIPAFVDDPAKYDELQTPLFDLKLELFNMEEGDPRFETVTRRIEAYEKDIPEKLHGNYVEYYEIPSAGYENERYLMEHEEFYRYMVDSGAWQEKDFSNVPTLRFEEKFTEYEEKAIGSERYAFRGANLWFDEEGVRLGKWKPYQEPTEKPEEPPKPPAPKKKREPKEGLTPTEEFRRGLEEQEKEFEEALKEIEEKLKGLG